MSSLQAPAQVKLLCRFCKPETIHVTTVVQVHFVIVLQSLGALYTCNEAPSQVIFRACGPPDSCTGTDRHCTRYQLSVDTCGPSLEFPGYYTMYTCGPAEVPSISFLLTPLLLLILCTAFLL